MRLIDADKLGKVLADYQNNISPWFDEDNTEWNAVELCMEYLDEQPTVDPVVHAKWEALASVRNPTWFKCSICGREIHLGDIEVLSDYPYCHCGAKMDEE